MNIYSLLSAGQGGVVLNPSAPSGDLVAVAKHIRGHKAAFADNTDTWQVNRQAAEMFGLRNNIGLFCFDIINSTEREDAYRMGRVDFGWYDNANSIATIEPVRQGRPITALSYASGTDNNKLDYLDNVFTGRNSEQDTVPLAIQYDGLTDVDLISRASTIRMNYYTEMTSGDFLSGTFEQGKTKLADYVSQTITGEGWFTNFMHWHWWEKNYSRDYFAYLKTLIENEDVYSGSYSDIGEYYFVSNAVDSISYSNGTVNISYSKKYPNSPYHKITTPLWVKVDLNGTSLEGSNITTSHGGKIRSVGGNVFYVSIDLDFTQTTISFNISETGSPNYINLNKPVVNRNGNGVTSDQPIKISLFSKLKTETYELSVILDERQLTPATSFTLATTLDTVNRDYYLGFINDEGISGTLEF